MAKRDEPKQSKGKMTFIMFQLDGDDETLQQSFRTIGQALQNSFQRAKALPMKPSETNEPPVREIQTEFVDDLSDEDEEPEPAAAEITPRSQRVRNRPLTLSSRI